MNTPIMPGKTVGQRLTIRRRGRGLSRRVVANLVGRSEEWLRLVESGQRKLDSLETLARLAEVLQIDEVTELIDWPYRTTLHSNHQLHEKLQDLRRAIINHPALRVCDNEPNGYDSELLATMLMNCRWTWTSSGLRYSQLTHELPKVIEGARFMHWQLQSLATADQLLDTYHITRLLLTACGDHGMAATVADRAMSTVAQMRQPLPIAASAWHVAATLLHSGQPSDSYEYALAAVRLLSDEAPPTADADILRNALRLAAARAAAVAGDRAETAQLLAEARSAAIALGRDQQVREIPFGPGEVGITAIEIALTQHDPDQAIRLAATVQIDDDQPSSRRAAFYISQARAYVLRHEDTEATLALMKVAEFSPEDLRYDAEARRCVQHLLRRDNYLTRTEVRHLANLAGAGQ